MPHTALLTRVLCSPTFVAMFDQVLSLLNGEVPTRAFHFPAKEQAVVAASPSWMADAPEDLHLL